MIRIAVIGVGKIARDQHLPVIAASADFDLVATIDPEAHTAGVPHFETIAAMLEGGPAVDAVAICTPPRYRADIAARAIAAGLHVMVEKPPAMTVAEGEALASSARASWLALFTAWHSREAAGVPPARRWLAQRTIRAVAITWREDIRKWHPGQDWILEAGGFGVFDPGINALSIATAILPGRWQVTEAEIFVPENRAGPIAAEVRMTSGSAPMRATFDFRETDAECWTIAVETDQGRLLLADGGATLSIDGQSVALADSREYPRLYRRFAELVAQRAVDADLAPLELVTRAMALADRRTVDAFDFDA